MVAPPRGVPPPFGIREWNKLSFQGRSSSSALALPYPSDDKTHRKTTPCSCLPSPLDARLTVLYRPVWVNERLRQHITRGRCYRADPHVGLRHGKEETRYPECTPSVHIPWPINMPISIGFSLLDTTFRFCDSALSSAVFKEGGSSENRLPMMVTLSHTETDLKLWNSYF